MNSIVIDGKVYDEEFVVGLLAKVETLTTYANAITEQADQVRAELAQARREAERLTTERNSALVALELALDDRDGVRRELAEAISVLMTMAGETPLTEQYEDNACVYCGLRYADDYSLTDHKPDCIWRKAREFLTSRAALKVKP